MPRRRLRWFLIMMRIFMQLATWALRVGLLIVTARDALSGSLSIGAFFMVFLLSAEYPTRRRNSPSACSIISSNWAR